MREKARSYDITMVQQLAEGSPLIAGGMVAHSLQRSLKVKEGLAGNAIEYLLNGDLDTYIPIPMYPEQDEPSDKEESDDSELLDDN